MVNNKLSLAIISVAAVLASSLVISVPVFAQHSEGKDFTLKIAKTNGERDNENEGRSKNLNKIIKWTTSCTVVTSTAAAPNSILTYGDVVNILNADSQRVQTILSSNTTTPNTLSVGEMALLNVLRGKRSSTPNTVGGKSGGISSQIQALLGVVQPLGNATISVQIKKPLVNALKDLNNQINNLSKLTCKRVPVYSLPNISTVSPTTTTTTLPTYTMAQVQAANKAQNCLSVISGGVYNLTSWIAQHPGGSNAILGICGKDGTTAFMNQHGGQGNPMNVLTGFKVGILQ